MVLAYRSRWWRFPIPQERGELFDLFQGYGDLGGFSSNVSPFSHDTSAPGDGGIKFICGYLPRGKSLIELNFYTYFCLSLAL